MIHEGCHLGVYSEEQIKLVLDLGASVDEIPFIYLDHQNTRHDRTLSKDRKFVSVYFPEKSLSRITLLPRLSTTVKENIV
jgi:hypothetical protein